MLPGVRNHHLIKIACALLAVLLLTACASSKPRQRTLPVTVQLSFVGAAVLNPDANDRPSPVVLSVYGVRKTSSFETVDYFALTDAAAAGGATENLELRESFSIRPGETLEKLYTFDADIISVGVVAGFRQIERSRWRVSTPLPTARPPSRLTALIPKVLKPDHASASYTVTVGADDLQIRDTPAK